MPATSHPLSFRKSSYSSARQENCVEVADFPGGAAVRDSKTSAQRHLAFPADEWASLLQTVARP